MSHLDVDRMQPLRESVSSGGWRFRQLSRWAITAPRRMMHRRARWLVRSFFPAGSHGERLLRAIGLHSLLQPDMSWVTPNLAVGGRVSPHHVEHIAGAGVTCIVDTRSEAADDKALLDRHGILFAHLPTPDNTPLTAEQLTAGGQWINERIAGGHAVLVHCENGIGRSVMLVVAALMMTGLSAEEALCRVQRARWQAAPNRSQIRRLFELERARPWLRARPVAPVLSRPKRW